MALFLFSGRKREGSSRSRQGERERKGGRERERERKRKQAGSWELGAGSLALPTETIAGNLPAIKDVFGYRSNSGGKPLCNTTRVECSKGKKSTGGALLPQF